MIVIGLLALLLLVGFGAAVVGGGLSLGSSGGGRDRSAGGGSGLVVPGLGGLVVVALLLAAGVVLLGGGLGSSDGGSADVPVSVAPTSSAPPARVRAAWAEVVDPSAIHLFRVPDDRLAPAPPVVERLADGDVLRVTVAGFEPSARGIVVQCPDAGSLMGACTNRFPVFFDTEGFTSFQYQVRETTRDDAAVVVVSGDDRVSARTVFGRPAPPAVRLEVERVGEIADGDTVIVRVAGLSAGERAEIVMCAPPAVSGALSCGAPGPAIAVVADSSGGATGRLAVRTGPVGAGGRSCEEGVACGIAVRTGDVLVPGAIVPVAFAPEPGAVYDATRLALGVVAAAALLLLAWWLIRTTDWGVPSEGATPALDAVLLD